MDKLSAMEAFVRVVEAGTFTKAAESMGVPKPTMTRLIQMLEADLKAQLLNRTTRRVSVTAEGAAYYERAVRILSDIDELESSVSASKTAPRGRLRVDVGSVIAQYLVIPALEEFRTRYPEIYIDLGVSDRPVDMVTDNVDCVVGDGELTDQSVVARKVGELKTFLVASPRYIEQHGVPRDLDDLAERHRIVDCFYHRTGRAYGWSFKNGSERVEIKLRHFLAVNDAAANLVAGVSGLGVTRTTELAARQYLASGQLIVVLPQWTVSSTPVHVVYPPNRHLGTKLRVFVDWIAELFDSNAATRLPDPLQVMRQRAKAIQHHPSAPETLAQAA